MPAPTPKQIRQARAYLHQRRITTGMISPKDFAQASNDLDASFSETMKLVRELLRAKEGGAPPNPAPIATELAKE
jgi:hypothetical protein